MDLNFAPFQNSFAPSAKVSTAQLSQTSPAHVLAPTPAKVLVEDEDDVKDKDKDKDSQTVEKTQPRPRVDASFLPQPVHMEDSNATASQTSKPSRKENFEKFLSSLFIEEEDPSVQDCLEKACEETWEFSGVRKKDMLNHPLHTASKAYKWHQWLTKREAERIQQLTNTQDIDNQTSTVENSQYHTIKQTPLITVQIEHALAVERTRQAKILYEQENQTVNTITSTSSSSSTNNINPPSTESTKAHTVSLPLSQVKTPVLARSMSMSPACQSTPMPMPMSLSMSMPMSVQATTNKEEQLQQESISTQTTLDMNQIRLAVEPRELIINIRYEMSQLIFEDPELAQDLVSIIYLIASDFIAFNLVCFTLNFIASFTLASLSGR